MSEFFYEHPLLWVVIGLIGLYAMIRIILGSPKKLTIETALELMKQEPLVVAKGSNEHEIFLRNQFINVCYSLAPNEESNELISYAPNRAKSGFQGGQFLYFRDGMVSYIQSIGGFTTPRESLNFHTKDLCGKIHKVVASSLEQSA